MAPSRRNYSKTTPSAETGRPVTSPPNPTEALARRLHGFMRGSVVMPDGFDLTAPVLDETLNAARGVLWDGDPAAEIGAPPPLTGGSPPSSPLRSPSP